MNSAIHDHTDSHCFVKVLQGELMETRYAWPAQTPSAAAAADHEEAGRDEDGDADAPLTEIGQDTFTTNAVTYINDE
jgi:cysteine dioxygenase